MIDWMTLRYPLAKLPPAIQDRVLSALGRITCVSPDGEIRWEKPVLDLDALRSDTPGLCWTVTGGADGEMRLTIGASPAFITYGNNVFGSSEVRECAGVLTRFASKCLASILPPAHEWECRRIDFTENYALSSKREVKQFLRQLITADAGRAKATSGGGDSVYWNKGSDLRKGKGYGKGDQLRKLVNDRKAEISDDLLELADRLARLELTLGARWFRRLAEEGRNWWDLTTEELQKQHEQYFERFIGKQEVTDMGMLLEELEKVAPTKGRALAAHRTWAMIKAIGYELARESMPRATWFLHLKYLRAAGLSDADIGAGNVLPFRRREICIAQPVRSWAELRAVA
ncbi:MAG: hypothetical protein JSR83_22410 [Proteobacteria bacterium]|nr:hypothetical protein [Pseudomonadota bacterium]